MSYASNPKFLGASIIPLCFFALITPDDEEESSTYQYPLSAFKVFRGLVSAIFAMYCASAVVYVCDRHNIKIVSLLKSDSEDEDEDEDENEDEDMNEEANELNPNKDDDPQATTIATQILLKAQILSIIYLTTFIIYTRSLSSSFAPMLPLMAFLLSMYQIIFPWTRFKNLLLITLTTVKAPFTQSSFRDGFVGDLITSLVRPLQDLSFTTFYFLSASNGWLSPSSSAAEVPVATNWLLNEVILPACVISPLWWRFAQNLRRVLETKKRWPHLGNALKYFLAAQVALFAIYDPELKSSWLWIMMFCLTTVYQIFWDMKMDWDIFDGAKFKFNYNKPRAFSRSFYTFVIFSNLLLRFVWTISLVPPKYLGDDGALHYTFGKRISLYLTPFVAFAEIFRRSTWALLRLEAEQNSRSMAIAGGDMGGGMEMTKMEIGGRQMTGKLENFELSLDGKSDEVVIVELTAYGFAFLLFGFIASVTNGFEAHV